MKKNAGQIGIFGCRGSGKTTCQKELLEERRYVIALDPMGTEFRGPGWKRCTNKDQIILAIKEGWNHGFRLAIPTGVGAGNCERFIGHFVPLLFDIQQPYSVGARHMVGHEITLAVDEADLFFPNKGHARTAQELVDNLTRRGRHYGIETIAASQRLAQVSTTFRGNCTEQYFFMQSDHTDIKAALASLGPQHQRALRALKPHDYLHKSGATVVPGRNRSKFVK